MKTPLILLAAVAALLIPSCTPTAIDVVDKSYEIRSDVSFDKDALRSVVTFTLERGDADKTYEMTYSIDGEYLSQMHDLSGNPVQNNFKLDFRRSPSVRYYIEGLPYGPHVLSLDISCDGITRHLDCPFDVPLDRFAFHAETNTGSSVSSAVMVSLLEGRTDKLYSVEVRSGDETLASCSDVDFSVTPICSAALPVMRPGTYPIDVILSDGLMTVSEELVLDEPVRFPEVRYSLKYNTISNSIELSVDRNPYRLWMRTETDMSVSGSCWVNLQTGYFHGGPNTTKHTKSLAESVSTDRLVPDAGESTPICCFNDLDRRMTSMTEQSWVWAEGYNYEMEEEGTWCLNFTQSVPYTVDGRSAAVRLYYENVSGVKVVLSGQNVNWITPSLIVDRN